MFWGQCTLCPSRRFDQTYFGAQKNRLIETVVLRLNNICFGCEIGKLIFNYALLSAGLVQPVEEFHRILAHA